MNVRSQLSVYYGDPKRWDHSVLQRVQERLGRECDGFDGLQADFLYDAQSDAIAALFLVRGLGIRSQVGTLGIGPTQEAINEAREGMRSTYQADQD